MAKQVRKLPRRHLVYYLKVIDAANGQVFGHLVDITPFGMMLISKIALEPGIRMDIRIQLPEEVDGISHIDLTGQTIWCHKDVNPDYYAAGFEFQSPTVTNSFIIRDLIDSLGFQD